MKSRWFLLFIAIVLLSSALVLSILPGRGPEVTAAQEAPEIKISAVHGGCYIAGPNQCKIHVEPFKLSTNTSKTLVAFQVLANRSVIYDFRTDLSNPPATGDFMPSLVTQDFAATCGKPYTLNLYGRDSGDSQIYNLAQSGVFTCPVTVPASQ